mgnify:CR=1 FL=1
MHILMALLQLCLLSSVLVHQLHTYLTTLFTNEGYLLISVEDRILFHKWSKEIDMFTSGVATSENIYFF